jgi:hypothetical protein
MRFSVGILIGACMLGGCSPSGQFGHGQLLGSLPSTEQFADAAAGVEADQSAALDSTDRTSQIQAYAANDGQTAQAAPAGGGLAGLFGAFRTERAPAPEPPPPGEFIAPEQAPLPVSRPDYGDRPKVDLAALARAESERLVALANAGAPAAAGPESAQALARSLNAYERREAGVPDDEDDDELEQIAVTPSPPGQTNASAPKAGFSYTPAHFEIAGVQPLPSMGAAPGAAARSSNGLAINAPAQRWRAAYDTVDTACFPQQLRNALNNIAAHFNADVLVTSGARYKGRRGSLHRSCKAADIRIAGVAPAEIAAYARTVPGLNGVGTYRRVAVTHIDVRDERFAWRW